MATTTFKNNMTITGNLAVDGTVTSTGAITATEPTTGAPGAAGITAGTGTIHGVTVTRSGSIIETKIVMDITGLTCGGADGDIIGVASAADCHIGQITAAANGTIFAGYMRCLEVPAGGDPDINLYANVESTGTQDAAASGLTGTGILVNSGDLTLGGTVILTAFPAANEYLYLVDGTFTAAAYTAGKIEIVLYGT